MAQGFIQLSPDNTATGKPLDNDVVQVPAGTIVSDQFGNLTTLAAPAYYFRERVVNADPVDPRGLANVRNDAGGLVNDYGVVTRSPIGGIVDLQTIAALLQDIDQNIATLANFSGNQTQIANFLHPVIGIDQSIQSPGVPRRQMCDIFGRAITVPYSSREAVGSSNITITATTAAQALITQSSAGFSVPANNYLDIIALVACNTSATATELDISDGIQTIPMYLPAGDVRGISMGGVVINSRNPGQSWTATTITSVSSVKIWTQYIAQRTV